jgi:hypoxanthine phosphoribosyltransferase
VPVVLPPMPDLVAVRDLNVLIADDVADTGETLATVHRIIEGHVKEARSAVLYKKSKSIIQPEYVWHETDQWITFPWSADEPLVSIDEALG